MEDCYGHLFLPYLGEFGNRAKKFWAVGPKGRQTIQKSAIPKTLPNISYTAGVTAKDIGYRRTLFFSKLPQQVMEGHDDWIDEYNDETTRITNNPDPILGFMEAAFFGVMHFIKGVDGTIQSVQAMGINIFLEGHLRSSSEGMPSQPHLIITWTDLEFQSFIGFHPRDIEISDSLSHLPFQNFLKEKGSQQ